LVRYSMLALAVNHYQYNLNVTIVDAEAVDYTFEKGRSRHIIYYFEFAIIYYICELVGSSVALLIFAC